jgi:cation diffusion facilitator CzcD-associated flavoprotein CzcO
MFIHPFVHLEPASTGGADVAVIGAGSSGLAVVNALHEHDVAVDCFERGSADVGNHGWRWSTLLTLGLVTTNLARTNDFLSRFSVACGHTGRPV